MKAIVNSAAQTSCLKKPGREICYNQADLPYHSWEVWGPNHQTSTLIYRIHGLHLFLSSRSTISYFCHCIAHTPKPALCCRQKYIPQSHFKMYASQVFAERNKVISFTMCLHHKKWDQDRHHSTWGATLQTKYGPGVMQNNLSVPENADSFLRVTFPFYILLHQNHIAAQPGIQTHPTKTGSITLKLNSSPVLIDCQLSATS